MKATRFFSMAYDIRHHPKIDMLRQSQGGIAAFGRWVALMGILYDAEGVYDFSTPIKRAYLARELELTDSELDSFLKACADCDLLSAEFLAHDKAASPGICEQLDFVKRKSDAGKKGMAKRWGKGDKPADAGC